MDPIHRGTVGMPIRLTLLDDGVVYDPATAAVKTIRFTKPDRTTSIKTATVGTDSLDRPCLEYTTVAGDLDRTGVYRVQGYIEDASGKWPAAPVTFRVYG